MLWLVLCWVILFLTGLTLCADLSLRSGRQGSAGVQPEHLAVLGLQKKHPGPDGGNYRPGFLFGMPCKPRAKAKNSS
jgi:hypothetical protein